MNPYSGANFFQFFYLLFKRLISGGIWTPAADEVQLAVLSCCALACGLIGPFLTLKRMSMFANSLSHTVLPGIVIAFLLVSTLWQGRWNDPSVFLLGALFAAVLTAVLTEGLGRLFRLQEDASIGLVFTSLFAIGVALVTLYTRNAHLSVEAIMGNPDALQLSDLRFSALIALFNLLAVALLYRRLLLSAFDESLGRTLGFSAFFSRSALFLITALTCMGAFRAVGALVVLALLVGPYLIARLFCHRVSHLLIWTPLIGILLCSAGVALSRAILSTTGVPLSTSGLIATLIGAAFLLATSFKKLRFLAANH
ncbi:MAG: metal ABC transporter permease [Verrucomicrobiota bacterium]|nr:metal ABC transporter permease [Verrucomicrobiota bacterium]